MNNVWLYVFPIFAYALNNKLKQRQQSVADGDPLKIKADNFFVFLIILVFVVIICVNYAMR
jgi:hypothetical protein